MSSKCIPLLTNVLELINTKSDVMDVALKTELYAVLTHIVSGFVNVHTRSVVPQGDQGMEESAPVIYPREGQEDPDRTASETQTPLVTECESLALTTPMGSGTALQDRSVDMSVCADLLPDVPATSPPSSSSAPDGRPGDGTLKEAVSLLVRLALSIGQATRHSTSSMHDAELVRDCLDSLMHLLKAHPDLQETFMRDEK